MGGGLINIVAYASTDLYLSGSPQITFYKMVYRRYTNFAIESIYLDFDGNIRFDEEIELTPPRIGDLMHKGYLHISIPSFVVTKQDIGIDSETLNYVYFGKSSVAEFQKIQLVYMKIMADIYRLVHKAINASNVSYTTLVRDVYDYITSDTSTMLKLAEYDALLLEKRQNMIDQKDPFESIMDSTRSNLWYILTHIDATKLLRYADKSVDLDIYPENSDSYTNEIQRLMKIMVFKEIDRGFEVCKNVQLIFFNKYSEYVRRVESDRSNNIKCAWVNKLGHSIIEYIDIFIGGKRIDRHWGVWIDVWYQLTHNNSQSRMYASMIGDVPELNNFDNQTKPAYDLYIPLSFWFNKYNGLSFPLIAMQYNTIKFVVKLRKFEEVFFIERIYQAKLNGSDVVLTADMIDFIQNLSENKSDLVLTGIHQIQYNVLKDIWEKTNKQLFGHILMDYVYLESNERKRFAQSGHEYLIERIQTNVFDNIDRPEYDARLDFTNPCKELVWFFTKGCLLTNSDGSINCRWNDHTVNFGKINPVEFAQLAFNNYTRVSKLNGAYFNYYQPMTYHRNTPDDGINLQSFSLSPLQHQPSGTCNLTKIVDVRLFNWLNPNMFRYNDSQLYPYDLGINFKFFITDPETLLDKIDINYVNKVIKDYNLVMEDANSSTNSIGTMTMVDTLKTVDNANITLRIYNKLKSGTSVEIVMNEYRKLILKTSLTMHVMDITVNILRIIGGYGALAYTSND